MIEHIQPQWQIRKPAVSSNNGLVATQHYLASDIGANVLKAGGNAIDAAIAAGLALGVVEPWMSGLGGGGYMTVYLAATDEVKVVIFGMQAPLAAEADDYPLAGEGQNASDAFNWPKVVGDTNVHGPLSIAVPGYLRGIELALQTFGTWQWQQVIEPACQQAELGLPIDWFSAQKINQWARFLNLYPETRRVYLGDGLPPAANIDGSLKRLQLGELAATYRQLQQEGAGDYYTGKIAEAMVQDLGAAGSRITAEDLAGYTASIDDPLSVNYRDNTLYVSGPLTAGPSIVYALQRLNEKLTVSDTGPDPLAYEAYAASLFDAYEHRLEHLGAAEDPKTPGNTSHICVTDNAGNMVSLTQTIMSAFGSRVMLPQSGLLMNNGMMWFDPRPGRPNSVAGGRKPLCNMCPVILRHADGALTAMGACGGRRIFPAVFQLASLVTDFEMSIDDAVHTPRIDVSGTDLVTVMDHAPDDVVNHLKQTFTNVQVQPNGVSPNLFALPQVVKRNVEGGAEGGCFIPSPHAKVSSPDEL